MKTLIKPTNKFVVLVLALCAFFGMAMRGNSQSVTVTVDTTQSWVGYMNVYTLSDGYEYGTAWGTSALQADFVGGTQLDLSPCTNVWETTDTYYVQSDGEPNDIMDAVFYVDTSALVNTNVIFSGTCLSNTLTANPYPGITNDYTCEAFIEVFNSSYGELAEVTSNMVAGQPFSISMDTTIAGAAYVQYGFQTIGPDANPTNYPSLGNVVIAAVTPTVPTPTNAAPTPTNSPSGVLAMYDSSGEYPEAPVDDMDASWSDPSEGVVDYAIPGTTNTVLEYTNLEYEGWEFYTPDEINVSAYNEMHLDVWTPNANQFGISLISLDNSGTQGATVDFGDSTIVPGQWISLDIPLSEFEATNSTLDLTALQQMEFLDNMGGLFTGGTFYVDNIYFYSNSALAPPPPPLPQPTNAAPTPSSQLNNVIAMWDSSGVYTPVVVEDYDASWSDPAYGVEYFTITNTGNVVLEYPDLQYAGWEFYNTSDEQINVSDDNTAHIDLWTPTANQFGIQLVSLDSGVGTGTQAGQVNITPASGTIASNQWVSLDIPLYQFTALKNTLDDSESPDLTDLQQLLFIDNQVGGVTGAFFYVDNFYFYESTNAVAVPMTAAITNGTVNLSFPTEYGFNYTVQWTASLTNPNWQTVSGASDMSGNNYTQTATDSSPPNQASRFYRLSVTPSN